MRTCVVIPCEYQLMGCAPWDCAGVLLPGGGLAAGSAAEQAPVMQALTSLNFLPPNAPGTYWTVAGGQSALVLKASKSTWVLKGMPSLGSVALTGACKAVPVPVPYGHDPHAALQQWQASTYLQAPAASRLARDFGQSCCLICIPRA